MINIPVAGTDQREIVRVKCQPRVERKDEVVVKAEAEHYQTLQSASGLVWVRFDVPHAGNRIQHAPWH